MPPQRLSNSKRLRFFLISVGIIGVLGFALALEFAPQFETLALGFALASFTACVVYLLKYLRIDSSSEPPRGSLERMTVGYGIFLLSWLVVGVIGFSLEHEISNLSDFAAVVGFGIVSIGFWGTVVYVGIVLPIWFLVRKIRKVSK